MDERLLRHNKKYFIFCSIIGVIMLCCHVFLFYHFIDARIYFGEKPYMFGENPSELFVDLFDWVGIINAAMAVIGIVYLLVGRKKQWTLQESRKLMWVYTAGELLLTLYGGYHLFKYHGRELYCDIEPILNRSGQPYLIDTFFYIPLAAGAITVIWGAYLLYRLYKPESTGRKS